MRILLLAILFFLCNAVIEADLPAAMQEESSNYGDIVFTEIIMDDDGDYAALPAQGFGNIKSAHSAEVDLVLELRNITSGTSIDIKDWTIWYITEPYEYSTSSTLRVTGTSATPNVEID